MKALLILLAANSLAHSQVYYEPSPNEGPDHGTAKNFAQPDWEGVSYVRSEITIKGQTYSFVRTGEDNFHLFRKVDGQFVDIAKIPGMQDSFDQDSRLLHVEENEEAISILGWGVKGYGFVRYQKRPNAKADIDYVAFIPNGLHIMWGIDTSIKSMEFIAPDKLKILKSPSKEYPETELNFELRRDGVLLNGKNAPGSFARIANAKLKRIVQDDNNYYGVTPPENPVPPALPADALPAPAQTPSPAAPDVTSSPPPHLAITQPAEQAAPVVEAPWPWILALIAVITAVLGFILLKQRKSS
jgi:hypothetical protein